MIQKLEIEGYRCFEKLTVEGLGRLNLIVGENNSGKTSLLEAIQLVTSSKPEDDLKQILASRGEVHRFTSGEPKPLDLQSLFWGRTFQNPNFQIRASSSGTEDQTFRARIVGSDSIVGDPPYSFEIETDKRKEKTRFAIHRNGGVILNSKPAFSDLLEQLSPPGIPMGTLFIPSNSIPVALLKILWQTLRVEGFDDGVLQILHEFDSDIEKFDFLPDIGDGNGHIKLKGISKWVPLGTLGDGAFRLLALSCAAVQSRGVVLLVDEIDTAFHYKALFKVWKMLNRFALNSDTQIFATTHSHDCIEAFARLVRDGIASSDDLSLQRVVKEKHRAVPYTGDQILAAIQYDYEVR